MKWLVWLYALIRSRRAIAEGVGYGLRIAAMLADGYPQPTRAQLHVDTYLTHMAVRWAAHMQEAIDG